jgi:hypothetical protein
VLDAIKRKDGKAIFSLSSANRHLVIYPNSNASSFLEEDDDEERSAFLYLKKAVTMARDTYIQAANGCSVHVLGSKYVCFDLLGKAQLVRREAYGRSSMKE